MHLSHIFTIIFFISCNRVRYKCHDYIRKALLFYTFEISKLSCMLMYYLKMKYSKRNLYLEL